MTDKLHGEHKPGHDGVCSSYHELAHFLFDGCKLVRNKLGWHLVLGKGNILYVPYSQLIELSNRLGSRLTVGPFHATVIFPGR